MNFIRWSTAIKLIKKIIYCNGTHPIKDIEIKHLLQNALVDEINSHEIFMKSINIIYYHEGYTEYNIEDL